MTKAMPAAELEIGPELVRRLLAEQHPDLAGRPLNVLANGWDNVLVRAGDDLLVRLPRRAAASELIVNEQRWLPVLAPGLPLPVPAPVRVGWPGDGYPWHWSVSAFIPGESADRTPPGDAAVLGEFLAALHTPASADAPRNPYRGIPLADRAATFAENLALLGGADESVTRIWEQALAAPGWGGPPVWLHGDLHPANVLVDDGRISGVVDFGDITAGDPANDLAVIWMLPVGPDDFWQAYARTHTVDDALVDRARGWALAMALVFLAHSADNPAMERIGRSTLDAVLAGR